MKLLYVYNSSINDRQGLRFWNMNPEKLEAHLVLNSSDYFFAMFTQSLLAVIG